MLYLVCTLYCHQARCKVHELQLRALLSKIQSQVLPMPHSNYTLLINNEPLCLTESIMLKFMWVNRSCQGYD